MNIFSKFIKPKPDKALYADGVRKERSFLIWQNNDFFLRESYKTTRTNVMFTLPCP